MFAVSNCLTHRLWGVPKFVAGHRPVHLVETGTVAAASCCTALHADDVRKVANLCRNCKLVQSADVSNVICVMHKLQHMLVWMPVLSNDLELTRIYDSNALMLLSWKAYCRFHVTYNIWCHSTFWPDPEPELVGKHWLDIRSMGTGPGHPVYVPHYQLVKFTVLSFRLTTGPSLLWFTSVS